MYSGRAAKGSVCIDFQSMSCCIGHRMLSQDDRHGAGRSFAGHGRWGLLRNETFWYQFRVRRRAFEVLKVACCRR